MERPDRLWDWLARSHLTLFRLSDVQALLRDGGLVVLESEVFEGTIPSWFAVARKRSRA